MPFEYYLEPAKGTGPFDEETMSAMRAFLDRLPHLIAPDGSYALFATPEEKDVYAPILLERAREGRNSYLEPIVHISPEQVFISRVGARQTDQYLRDFVVYCQQLTPCVLYEGSEEVPADELLIPPGEG